MIKQIHCETSNVSLPAAEFDQELADAMIQNARRYINILSEAVYEMLPDYKEREVCCSSIFNY